MLGVAACEKPAPPNPYANLDLVPVPTKIADIPLGPAVISTKTAILVHGKPVVSITNGDVDPADKDGLRLPKLTTALLAAPKATALVIALDRSTPYRIMIDEMATAKAQGLTYKDFALVALATDTHEPTALPIRLPETPRGAAINDGDVKPPIQMVVAATSKDFLVWSISGLEGTMQTPKLTVPLADPQAPEKVHAVLSDVVTRNFSGHLPDDQHEVLFMGSDALPASTFLPMMVAMHGVFPDIQLASGFQ
ncbi:MAG: hypothetical protein QM831_22875 [Kofleriaceae bacterium]